jgi:hypothetical protein
MFQGPRPLPAVLSSSPETRSATPEAIVMSPPCAVRSGVSSVDVFAAGAHSELLHWQFLNGAWNRWPVIGTVGGAVPLATHVVPPGPHRYWESLGGILTSPPTAALFGDLDDALVVFASGTDHALWTRGSFGGSWRDWESLGGGRPNAPRRQRQTPAMPKDRPSITVALFAGF